MLSRVRYWRFTRYGNEFPPRPNFADDLHAVQAADITLEITPTAGRVENRFVRYVTI